jgi:hypothetical protein
MHPKAHLASYHPQTSSVSSASAIQVVVGPWQADIMSHRTRVRPTPVLNMVVNPWFLVITTTPQAESYLFGY